MKTVRMVLGVLAVGLLSGLSWSQPYKTAIGVRLGYPNNVNFSLKHNFASSWGLELNAGAGYRSAGVDFSVMYHVDIKPVSGMRWFVGGAVDAGAFYRNNFHPKYGYAKTGAFSMGTSIFGGVEYSFPQIPLNLQADLGPRLPIFPWNHYNDYVRVGISARYYF